jgi:hypothetical protein
VRGRRSVIARRRRRRSNPPHLERVLPHSRRITPWSVLLLRPRPPPAHRAHRRQPVRRTAHTVCSCSLGQITHALYEVGGQYRRSM